MTRQDYGGFDFNFFDEDEEGVVIEGFSKYPYLLMLTKLWHGYWNNKMERMNKNMYEDNGKAVVIKKSMSLET